MSECIQILCLIAVVHSILVFVHVCAGALKRGDVVLCAAYLCHVWSLECVYVCCVCMCRLSYTYIVHVRSLIHSLLPHSGHVTLATTPVDATYDSYVYML